MGDGHFVSTHRHTVEGSLGKANLVAVKASPLSPLVAVGSSDRSLRVLDVVGDLAAAAEPSVNVLKTFLLDGAVLCIDWDKGSYTISLC